MFDRLRLTATPKLHHRHWIRKTSTTKDHTSSSPRPTTLSAVTVATQTAVTVLTNSRTLLFALRRQGGSRPGTLGNRCPFPPKLFGVFYDEQYSWVFTVV